MVILLHQVYSPWTVRLLESFSHFSKISLFKPTFSHQDRTSFYLVAKYVDPSHERACRLLSKQREKWRFYTARCFDLDIPEDQVDEDQDSMEAIMEAFGQSLVTFAEPIWKIQKKGLVKRFPKVAGLI